MAGMAGKWLWSMPMTGIRDAINLILIAMALVVSGVSLAVLGTNGNAALLAILSCTVFLLPLVGLRARWADWRFWVAVVGLVACHLTLLSLFATAILSLPLGTYIPASMIEAAFIYELLARMSHKPITVERPPPVHL